MADAYFIRTRYDGVRQISWRMWLLVWILPFLLLGSAALVALMELTAPLGMERAEGEVVRVYEYEGSSPFDRGVTNYAPVFRYIRPDGSEAEASAGLSHPEWNFAIGSRHAILFDPDSKGDVRLVGGWYWFIPRMLALFGLIAALPALLATLLLRRWRGRGALAMD